MQRASHLPAQEFRINIATKGPVNVPNPRSDEILVDRDLSFIGTLRVSPLGTSDAVTTRLKVAGRSNLKAFLLAGLPEAPPPKEGGVGRSGEELIVESRYQFGVNFRGPEKSLWAMESSNDPGMQWILASVLALVHHVRTKPKVANFLVADVDGMRLEASVQPGDFNSTDPYLLKNFKHFRFTVLRRDSSDTFPNYVSGTFILQITGGKLKELNALYEIGNSPSSTEPRGVLQNLLSNVQLRLEDESLAKK
ncbi:MAG: hypothetical protein WCK51_09445 [Armatimonadota bacterium]